MGSANCLTDPGVKGAHSEGSFAGQLVFFRSRKLNLQMYSGAPRAIVGQICGQDRSQYFRVRISLARHLTFSPPDTSPTTCKTSNTK